MTKFIFTDEAVKRIKAPLGVFEGTLVNNAMVHFEGSPLKDNICSNACNKYWVKEVSDNYKDKRL